MRSVILVILSSLYLSAATELHELLRIPVLLEHFRQHRHQDPGLSLFEFLRVHYSGTHPADQDDSEDRQLPFKSALGINHLDTQPATLKETTEKFILPAGSSLFAPHPEGVLIHHTFAVFHPPRAV